MTEVSQPELSPGDVVGERYRVRREIARGGMAAVYEAEQIHLGRRVALKMLIAEARDVPTVGERLLREGRALELSRHPNVVEALDAGIDPRGPYLVLEMLDGRALDGLLAARNRLPLGVAVPMILELCAGLAAAHEAGVVHRDIKPSNIFVARIRGGTEAAKLIDFGIASVGPNDQTKKLTQVGERIGTYEYMAPEQLLGEDVDHRTDLFAVGVTLYEAIVGDVPFPGGPTALLTTLLSGAKPPSIAAVIPGVPAALDALIARTLSRDVAARPQSADELAKALRAATGVGREALRVFETQKQAPSGTEARRFARAPYVAPVRIRDANGVFHDGNSADLSEVGLLVILDAPLIAGERVETRFCLPVSGRVVTASATVRWCRAQRARHASGLEIEGLAPEALEDIRRFVSLTGS